MGPKRRIRFHATICGVLLASSLLLACGDDPSTIDKVPPAIASITPADGATGVSLKQSLLLTFSEAVAITDSTSFIRLLHNGAQLPALISRPERNRVQLTPLELLEPGERYDVVVSGSVRDDGGNVLPVNTTASFTTAGRSLEAIDLSALMLHLSRIAHDSMAGRGSGTADEVRAATYIAQQFQSSGVHAPPGDYLMQFAVPPARVSGRTGVTSQNVIGVIAGTGDLQNEWIVIGAHYDHVGIRTVGGVPQVFNGADDNGSGTAVLVQMARHLSTYISTGGLGSEARRSILFVAFGAEELGLIGSEHYCAQPKYPLTSVKAMLNFDMVGRMRNRTLMVGGLATAAEWRGLVGRYNRDNLTIGETDCGACTDFACFRRNQRPVLWFFTDLHPEYHTPSDDVALINTEGISQIANLALRLTIDLALRPGSLAFAQ